MSPQIKTVHWTKSYLIPPRDSLISHALKKKKQFKASFENEICQPPINLLMSGEYGWLWLKQRDEFLQQRRNATKRFCIKPFKTPQAKNTIPSNLPLKRLNLKKLKCVGNEVKVVKFKSNKC